MFLFLYIFHIKLSGMTNLNEKEIATSSFIWNEWLWFIAIAFKEVCYQSGQGGLSPGREQPLVSGTVQRG